LDRRVGIEQSGDISIVTVNVSLTKSDASFTATWCVGAAMTVHDEDPLEAVLSDLSADVRDQRPEGGLTKPVGTRMHCDVADLIRSRRAVVNHRHQDQVPIRQCDGETIRDVCRFIVDAERVGSDRQMRPVLFEHAHGQDKQSPVTIQGIDVRPRQLVDREDCCDCLLRAFVRSHPSAIANGRQHRNVAADWRGMQMLLIVGGANLARPG
jgi:hypothetical protein